MVKFYQMKEMNAVTCPAFLATFLTAQLNLHHAEHCKSGFAILKAD